VSTDRASALADDKLFSIVDLDAVRVSLGQNLARLRNRRGLTTRQLAEIACISQSKIVRIESGQLVPTVDDLELLLELLRASRQAQWDVFTDFITLASITQSGFQYAVGNSDRYRQREMDVLFDASTVIKSFDNLRIPSVLQTAAYTRTMFYSDDVDEAEIERAILERRKRQQELHDSTRQFIFLIYESCLHLRCVTTAEMVGQYQHLASISKLSNVTLGVVPFAVSFQGLYPDTGFCIYDNRFVTFDTGLGLMAWSWPEVTTSRIEAFDYLHAHALCDDAARRFLERLAVQIESEER
jgi:transcriptional regulator with XRE-family HTH domain